MQFVMVVLRLAHIGAGAFWVGSGLMLVLVILPALRRSGAEAGQRLPMAQISQAMAISSLITTIAGVILYILVSGFAGPWMASPMGIGLSIGAVAGLAAFLVGLLSTGPTSSRMGELGARLQAAGGPPAPEQLAEMRQLQAKLNTSSMWSVILSTLSLAFMAVARYL